MEFVEDDEFVEKDWMKKILEEKKRRDIDMVGYKVRNVKKKRKMRLWKRFVW